MNAQKPHWKQQTLAFDGCIKDALQQQHHAAQFIALVGKHLIAQRPDDSNTNMQYMIDKGMLAGKNLSNGMCVALQLNNLNLLFLDKENSIIQEILLPGKTKIQAFEELKQNIADSHIAVSNFINDLHYEIPEHTLDKGAVFTIEDKKYFQENTFYRYNSEIIINEIVTGFKNAEPVRIWPHHFDTGSLIPMKHNDKGETSISISLGWAIPDSMVNEPYYYLSFWSENSTDAPKKLKALDAGEWMMPVWNGAVLKHSVILKEKSAEGQYELVKSFFNSGIGILIDLFNL